MLLTMTGFSEYLYCVFLIRPVAQLARVAVSKTVGWGFESLQACFAPLRGLEADLSATGPSEGGRRERRSDSDGGRGVPPGLPHKSL